MKRPKVCIFCGVCGGSSKEHFWPEWLASHLLPTGVKSHVTEYHTAEGKEPQRLERRSERPGSVSTKKIRAVCATCNNGWMSALESKAKPCLLALIQQSNTTLSTETIKTLALWVTVKSIVAEHATESTALTTPTDRRAVYKGGVIPSYFRIFVAFHSLTTQTAYYRQSTTLSMSAVGPDPSLPNAVFRNVQATTFLVGNVCFYLTAARVARFNGATLDPVHLMHRLWPEPLQSIDLASSSILGQPEVSLVCHSLDRLVGSPHVKYGGPLLERAASET